MRKRKEQKTSKIDINSAIPIIRKIVLALLSGASGFAINWLFSDKFVEGLITLAVIGVFSLAGWLLTCVLESRMNVLHILNKDIKTGRYQEAVKLGYAVSRAWFLAGKNNERCQISKKVIEALDKLSRAKITTININDNDEDVSLLKAKITIDDYGWSYYLLDKAKNRDSAESIVKSGIVDCFRYVNPLIGKDKNDQEKEKFDKVCKTIFKGIRHLYAMRIEDLETLFETLPIQAVKSHAKLNVYTKNLISLGRFLGWLLNDEIMMNGATEEDCKVIIHDLFPEINQIGDFVAEFKNWVDKEMNNTKSAKFSIATYSPRTKYFLSMVRLCDISAEGLQPKQTYLDSATELALRMAVGYCTNTDDLKWITETFSFGKQAKDLFEDDNNLRNNDSERFVKSYVLLGTVAAASNNVSYFKEAKRAFEKAVEESEKVNRVDTYLRSQRKIISTNEKIFMYYYLSKSKSAQELQQDLIDVQTEMKKILAETQKFLGKSDPKMTDSCKVRAKKYNKIFKRLKES